MRTGQWLLLVMIMLASMRLNTAAAGAAADDGLGPVEERLGVQSTVEPPKPLYLVTYMKSRTTDPLRTATVVSVTNQANGTCQVSVDWFRGFEPAPVCTAAFSLGAGFHTDLCSRAIPEPLTTCNATCAPELTFDEGKAVVSATCPQIGVSARVYYTQGADDDEISAISDSKIVLFGQGNRGD